MNVIRRTGLRITEALKADVAQVHIQGVVMFLKMIKCKQDFLTKSNISLFLKVLSKNN
jgi:hypothetical protein